MQFTQTYLNKHHLTHTPHKWFLALLSTPIHTLEMRYKKKYHLRFARARQLFIFDTLLLFSTVLITAFGIYWYTYDPTITAQVFLEITPKTHEDTLPDGRIRSGEHMAYHISYKNNSDMPLTNATLTFQAPKGFLVENTSATTSYDPQTHTFTLPNIAPDATDKLTVNGFFYAPENTDLSVAAILTYSQAQSRAYEQKIARILTTLRGSILDTNLQIPERIIAGAPFTGTLSLTNTSHHSVSNLSIQLPETLNPLSATSTAGVSQKNTWNLTSLAPNESAELVFKAEISDTTQNELTIPVHILIDEDPTQIAHASAPISLAQPEFTASATWSSQIIAPGSSAPLSIVVQNTGDVGMEAVSIRIPVSAQYIDTTKLGSISGFSYYNNAIHIDSTHTNQLSQIDRSGMAHITIEVPIRNNITASTDVRLILSPEITTGISGIPETRITRSTTSDTLRIGTRLFIDASARYYTDEGDQLGRGPLPPRINEETRYWTLVRIQNTTSRVSGVSFTASLPPGIRWTGQTSVSHGHDVTFDPTTRMIRWNASELPAHTTAGVYFQVGWTPEAGSAQSTPLAQNIQVTAQDTYISAPIQAFTGQNLSSSLPRDTIAQTKGTLLQQ